jgi:selenocysteine lyase/cysteine desulfurase
MDFKTALGFAPQGTFLNTAMFGLPPARAIEDGATAVRDWARGRVTLDAWSLPVERARASLARLHGVEPDDVTLGASVSSLVSAVAAAVPVGGTVLLSDDEFLSLATPFEIRAAAHEFLVRRESRATLIDRVTTLSPTWVAASLVRPQDGQLLDQRALIEAARAAGTRVLLDISQAGWMPQTAVEADVMVGAGHKWLMGPHGTAFMIARPPTRASLVPVNAGWTARADLTLPPWGPQPRALSARGFDQSPAFLNWVVQASALEIIEDIGVAEIAVHDLELAKRLAHGLALPVPTSPIVTIPGDPHLVQRLTDAGVQHTARGGNIRLSIHLYNDADDIDTAINVLARSGLSEI